MAIALDAASISADGTTDTLTWAHTVGTLINGLLVVGIATGNANVWAQATVTGVTYNGVAMTQARADQVNTGDFANYMETSIWMLANPVAGAHNVVASISNNTHATGVACSYSGALPSSVADAVGGGSGTTSGAKTFTVTTVADNSWIFCIGANAADGSTCATAQTSRGTLSSWSGILCVRGADTNAAQTPPGSKTMGFTMGTTGSNYIYTMSGASFGPSGIVAIIANHNRRRRT